MKRITKTTSCVLLISLVLIGLGETDSLVLCIGHDGHISLEDSRSGICSHTLSEVARELGLSVSDEDVRKKAKCCPCTDMDLPGHALDYPEVLPPDVVCVPEPAIVPVPVFDLVWSEFICTPCRDFLLHPPPPDPEGNVARIALKSVVMLA
jgi:hypothetical protein